MAEIKRSTLIGTEIKTASVGNVHFIAYHIDYYPSPIKGGENGCWVINEWLETHPDLEMVALAVATEGRNGESDTCGFYIFTKPKEEHEGFH